MDAVRVLNSPDQIFKVESKMLINKQNRPARLRYGHTSISTPTAGITKYNDQKRTHENELFMR